ncbi:tetratricopeptide repeat protein [Providencia manganoxydans]|uniref:tetratricopeptide repeat protein n=1 Tax=Providencia manganoxydans TaxID=2923283 RepID=UPI0034E54547
MKIFTIVLFVLFLSGCCILNKEREEIIPSYRMLNYNYPSNYIKFDNSIKDKNPEPRNLNDFLNVKFKSENGDAESSFLMSMLHYNDSNCSSIIILDTKPNQNCLLAVEYLKKSLEQNPEYDLALFELGKMYAEGIGFKRNRQKAVYYLDRVMNKDEKGSELACEYLIYLHISNDDGEGVDLKQAQHYAEIGMKNGSQFCTRHYGSFKKLD